MFQTVDRRRSEFVVVHFVNLIVFLQFVLNSLADPRMNDRHRTVSRHVHSAHCLAQDVDSMENFSIFARTFDQPMEKVHVGLFEAQIHSASVTFRQIRLAARRRRRRRFRTRTARLRSTAEEKIFEGLVRKEFLVRRLDRHVFRNRMNDFLRRARERLVRLLVVVVVGRRSSGSATRTGSTDSPARVTRVPVDDARTRTTDSTGVAAILNQDRTDRPDGERHLLLTIQITLIATVRDQIDFIVLFRLRRKG